MPQDNRPVDSPVRPCACVTHNFDIGLGPAPDESKKVTGLCETGSLVTHSMGGLAARSAMKLFGAEGRVLGVVQSVQPACGAVAA